MSPKDDMIRELKHKDDKITVLLLALVILVPTVSFASWQLAVMAGPISNPGITYGPGDIDTYSWVVFKEGSTYYAKNGTTRAIDYSGTNATTLIQTLINTYSSEYDSISIYAKGFIQIDGALIFDNKRNMRFVFDFLALGTNSAKIIVRNKSVMIPTIIEGTYLLVGYGSYSSDAILLQDVKGVKIKIGQIENTAASPPWGGNALKLFSPTSTGVTAIDAEIGYISGFENGVLLNVTGASSWISSNSIRLRSVYYTVHAIKIESNLSGSPQIFANSFEASVSLPDLSGSPVTYGIYTTGKTSGNTFWDYENWDLPATSVSYYADNKTFGTRFIGGMPRYDVVSAWQDAGNATDFVSIIFPDTNIYTRQATTNNPLFDQTAALDNLALTKSPSTSAFEMGIYVNITAIAGATLRVYTEYYDKNNVVHDDDIFGALTTTGVSYNQTIVLAKGETYLKVYTTIAGGTIAYDISAWVIAR